MDTSLPVRVREGSGSGTLVLLHGRGGDENDLHALFDALDPEGRVTGITVGAPLVDPLGGRHWYTIPRVGFPDASSFKAALGQLERTLDDELSVDWSSTVVGGFSQGTAMAHAIGLGAGRPSPAGVLALSGFIPTVDGWTADTQRAGLRVFVAHGTDDPMISVDFARDARRRLMAGGATVEYRESPSGHTIDPRIIPEVARWLAGIVESDPRPEQDPVPDSAGHRF